MSATPRVGDGAPPLDLPATSGQRWRLADHQGRWTIIAFYPHDFGRLCTRQLNGYAAVHDELERLQADLVVVSRNDLDSHERFRHEHRFPFPLLADVDGQAVTAWGVAGPLRTAKRASFVIDPTGVIRDAFVSRTATTWRTAAELIAIVDTASRPRPPERAPVAAPASALRRTRR